MAERGLTICHLLHSLHLGGAEVLAERIVRRFAGAHRALFVCLDEVGELGERLRDQGYRVLNLARSPGVDLGIARRLRTILRDEAIDLVHAHHCGPFMYAAMARFPGRRPAVLLMEHGRPYPDGPAFRRMLVNRFLLRRHDRLVAVSEAVRRALIGNEGFPAHRIEVVPNGIDLSRYRANGPERATVRQELGLGSETFVLIQIARLAPIKDHATALTALDAARSQRADLRLVVAGDGPESSSIRAIIRDRGLESHVLMLGARSDIPRLLQGADAIFLTSRSEGIPLALIEGMATGLPAIATAVGGVPEVVVAGETGLLAPAGAASALAASILELACDPMRRTRMGQAGLERAHDVFSQERMMVAYERLYRAMTVDVTIHRARVGREVVETGG